MKTLTVRVPNHVYDILIGENLLPIAADYIKKIASPSKIMVVTDENVAPHYCELLCKSLRTIADVKSVVVPTGETTKSFSYLQKLYDEAFSFGMTRTDLMIALGGGVIGDLTGFCASTLLRGIDVVQIPTTLLAQVDSSVGGKTAIDVPQGKNLIGTFYQPKLVLIDINTLHTLPDKEFACGMAEVIKYGAIWDKDLFSKLEAASGRDAVTEMIDEMIFTCCDIKRQVVEQDEHDTALRMILNFGHTLGHIAEKAYDYSGYNHGEAVAFGMVIAAKLGEAIGITKPGVSHRIQKLAEAYHLPTHIAIDARHLSSVSLDKKTSGQSLRVILLEEIGKYCIYNIPLSEFIMYCEKLL